jgi:serine/threonine protein kinase
MCGRHLSRMVISSARPRAGSCTSQKITDAPIHAGKRRTVTLESGQKLAHYRLVEKIGEGGMGVVWKADDLKLGRAVAVKILPDEFARDNQRLVRFEREAKLLAALNHPNVASIYGFESDSDVHFLVLELVDGQTLSQMVKTGPLPMEEALDICRQVADGLEAAHAAGVIHRDLKPGNVVITHEGKAKVLDFGLAKGLEGTVESGSDLSMSPTVTFGGTQAGVVMGTAPYMSPEQARGKPLDKRTDIFSFGCLLYECLTGNLVFSGETVTDTLSAILQNEPDWTVLPERTPRRVRELLERCMEKSPRNRLHDIADARIELDHASAAKEWTTSGFVAAGETAKYARSSRRLPLLTTMALVAGLLLGAASWNFISRRPTAAGSTDMIRFSIVPPSGARVSDFGISPDGESIYFTNREEEVTAERPFPTSLFARRLDEFEARPVDGLEGYADIALSPDGRWFATIRPVAAGSSRMELVKTAVDGKTPPIKIADWPSLSLQGLAWVSTGEIVTMAPGPLRLLRFPDDGGTPPPPVTLVGLPDILLRFSITGLFPDGLHSLGTSAIFDESGWRLDLFLLDLESGEVSLLAKDAASGTWSPTGHILFSRRDAILALPFDLEQMKVKGSPVALLDGVRRTLDFRYGRFKVSRNGTLAFSASEGEELERRLLTISTDGEREFLTPDPRLFIDINPSPDGRKLAATVQNPGNDNYEQWVWEQGDERMRVLLAEQGIDFGTLVWSPDGKQVAFTAWGNENNSGAYLASIESPHDSRLLLKRESTSDRLTNYSFLPDGSAVLLGRDTEQGGELLLVSTDRPDTESSSSPIVVLPAELNASSVGISRDGTWIYYSSRKSGRSEIYARTMDQTGKTGAELPVSTNGGRGVVSVPGAGKSSQEFTYREGDSLMSVTITSRPRLTASKPKTILNLREYDTNSVAHLDGGRILLIQGYAASTEHSKINVIMNFDEVIRRRFAELDGASR